MARDLIAEEDAWWDSRWQDRAEAETEAMAYAESSADLYEFDSEDDRKEYIREAYEDRLAELEYEKGR